MSESLSAGLQIVSTVSRLVDEALTNMSLRKGGLVLLMIAMALGFRLWG